jgi:hypothetical protein
LPFISNKNTISSYYLKENNLALDINIHTKSLTITKNMIIINYLVLDSNTEYIYKVEVVDLYES